MSTLQVEVRKAPAKSANAGGLPVTGADPKDTFLIIIATHPAYSVFGGPNIYSAGAPAQVNHSPDYMKHFLCHHCI